MDARGDCLPQHNAPTPASFTFTLVFSGPCLRLAAAPCLAGSPCLASLHHLPSHPLDFCHPPFHPRIHPLGSCHPPVHPLCLFRRPLCPDLPCKSGEALFRCGALVGGPCFSFYAFAYSMSQAGTHSCCLPLSISHNQTSMNAT